MSTIIKNSPRIPMGQGEKVIFLEFRCGLIGNEPLFLEDGETIVDPCRLPASRKEQLTLKPNFLILVLPKKASTPHHSKQASNATACGVAFSVGMLNGWMRKGFCRTKGGRH